MARDYGLPPRLAEQVGMGGRVLATDIDTSWMSDAAGYQVRRHDVGVDPPPVGPFDLVHARLVLMHMPQRRRALTAMIDALAPGGRVIEEVTLRCNPWSARTRGPGAAVGEHPQARHADAARRVRRRPRLRAQRTVASHNARSSPSDRSFRECNKLSCS